MELAHTIGSMMKRKSGQIWSVTPNSTVYDAIEVMAEKGVGALLVMEGGKLAGIISERDYARKVVLKGKHSREMLVSEIMTSPVITVTPRHSIGECMHIITEKRIRHLPVLEGDTVVGVLSIGDLVNWIITVQEETIRDLEAYITGSSR